MLSVEVGNGVGVGSGVSGRDMSPTDEGGDVSSRSYSCSPADVKSARVVKFARLRAARFERAAYLCGIWQCGDPTLRSDP